MLGRGMGPYPPWEECDGPLYGCPWYKVGAVVLHQHIWMNTESSWTSIFSHTILALLERGFLGVQRDVPGWPKVPANRCSTFSTNHMERGECFPTLCVPGGSPASLTALSQRGRENQGTPSSGFPAFLLPPLLPAKARCFSSVRRKVHCRQFLK